MRKEQGFTLVEMVVVLLLFSMVTGGIFVLYKQHNAIFEYEQAYVKAVGSTRNAMEAILLSGRSSYRVLSSASVSGTFRDSGDHEIVLQIPSVDGSNVLIPGSYDLAVYYLEGNKLWQEIEYAAGTGRPASKRLLSESVTDFNLDYDNADYAQVKKVTVEIKTAESYRKGSAIGNLKQQFYLRNH
jgi:prepilin-type N-terminal cleavage/methylation domain-containing protein